MSERLPERFDRLKHLDLGFDNPTHEDPEVLANDALKLAQKAMRKRRRIEKRMILKKKAFHENRWMIRVLPETWDRLFKVHPATCTWVWIVIAERARWKKDDREHWGEARIGIELISVTTGLDYRTVRRRIRSLVDARLLDVISAGTGWGGDGMTNVYMVHGLKYD
jgi:hypothetical protein